MTSNPLLNRYPHPGKFEGEINLTEKLYELSLDSGQDEEISDEGFGHYMLFVDLDKDAELGDLEGTKAGILHTSDQGFVSGFYFDTVREARERWAELERDYEQFLGESEEE
jgi:hypothetical protein